MDLIALTKDIYRVRDDAKAIPLLASNFPMGFEDLGRRLIEGGYPSECDIKTRESYEIFKKLWKEKYDETLPEYKENGVQSYKELK